MNNKLKTFLAVVVLILMGCFVFGVAYDVKYFTSTAIALLTIDLIVRTFKNLK